MQDVVRGRRRAAPFTVIMAAAASAGCWWTNTAPFRHVGSAAPARLAVFSGDSLAIDELERPIAPPLTVGSELSGDLMVSGDPGIVSVAGDGKLVAHRAGVATIASRTGGSRLRVVVLGDRNARASSESVRVTAPELWTERRTIEVGAVVQVSCAGSREALRWSSSDEAVLRPLGRGVFLGAQAGAAKACAANASSQA